MMDPRHVDPDEAHRAAPTLANLEAALRELRSTGRLSYEADGSGPVLEALAGTAVDAVDAALAGIPEVRRFLGVMLVARESRLARERGGRARRRR